MAGPQFKISRRISKKLREKHSVLSAEVFECFMNRSGPYYSDSRADNQTDPPTYWFVAETDAGRVLKVVFVRYPDFFAIKSAFEPNDGSDALYAKLKEC